MELCARVTARDTSRSLYGCIIGIDLGFLSEEGAPLRNGVTELLNARYIRNSYVILRGHPCTLPLEMPL